MLERTTAQTLWWVLGHPATVAVIAAMLAVAVVVASAVAAGSVRGVDDTSTPGSASETAADTGPTEATLSLFCPTAAPTCGHRVRDRPAEPEDRGTGHRSRHGERHRRRHGHRARRQLHSPRHGDRHDRPDVLALHRRRLHRLRSAVTEDLSTCRVGKDRPGATVRSDSLHQRDVRG